MNALQRCLFTLVILLGGIHNLPSNPAFGVTVSQPKEISSTKEHPSENRMDRLKPQLVVGMALPLTGGLAPYGREILLGAEAAIETIRNSDDDLGSRIQLISEDSQSLVTGSQQAAAKLLTKDRAHILVGGISSENALTLAGVAESSKRPLLSLTNMDPKPNSYVFNSCLASLDQGLILSQFSRQDLQKKSAVMILEGGSSYSQAIVKSFETAFSRAGGQVLKTVEFTAGQSNFDSIIKDLKKLNPDLVVLPAHYRDAAAMIEAGNRHGLKAVFLGTDSWDSQRLLDTKSQNAMEGHYFVTTYTNQDPSETAKKFKDYFAQKHQKNPTVYAALGFDAVMSVAEILQSTDSTRTSNLMKGLNQGYCNGVQLDKSANVARLSLGRGAIISTRGNEFRFHKHAQM